MEAQRIPLSRQNPQLAENDSQWLGGRELLQCSAQRRGFYPWIWKIPEEGVATPGGDRCCENPLDRDAWQPRYSLASDSFNNLITEPHMTGENLWKTEYAVACQPVPPAGAFERLEAPSNK